MNSDMNDGNERVNVADVVLQFNHIGLEGDGDDGDGDNNGDDPSNRSSTADSLVIIGMGKRRVQVRKAKVNALAFTDVMKCAKDKLAKRNLKVNRHRRLVREEKEQRTGRKKRVLDECNGSSQLMEQGSSALINEAMNRLHSRQRD